MLFNTLFQSLLHVRQFRSLLHLRPCKIAVFPCFSQFSVNSNQVKRFYYGRGRRDPRDGYSKIDEELEKMPRTEVIRNGIKILKEELKLWKEEIKEKIEADPILIRRPGEIDLLFRFDSEQSRSQWILTADSDHREGYSECNMTPTPYGTAVFQGVLSSRVPKDGKTKKAGYCNMTSLRKRVDKL